MIVSIEIDHKRAPLALREQLSLREEEISEALDLLLNRHSLSAHAVLPPSCDLRDCTVCTQAKFMEAVILSTCNRTGIYALGGCPEPLARFLVSYRGPQPEELKPHLAVYENQAAVEHLFAVAAGLESQVLGEPQILGQVRKAYELALGAGAAGPVLAKFFRRAIHVGKRVRTETELGRHFTSLASVAVELAGRIHSDLSQVSALLIGTGEMGKLVARLLHERGVSQITIVSRSPERAADLACQLDVQPLAFEHICGVLARVDIVVSAIDALRFVVTASDVAESVQYRDGRPLLLIDLGVPRNLDPEIRELEGAYLHDLDDLKTISDAGLRRRQQEIPKAWQIVREETEAFMHWLRERRAAPVIKALRDHAETIRQEQLQWALRKLVSLNDREQQVIETLTTRLMNKFLHTPTKQLKSLAQQAESCEPFILFKQCFNLETDDGDEKGAATDSQDRQLLTGYSHRAQRQQIIVGTRGSTLALAQTQQVVERIRRLYPDIAFATRVIKTHGDHSQIHEIGAFVKELEEALRREEIDLAVHSLKDLPTQLPQGLVMAAVLPRADPRDVLISREGFTLEKLPKRARVGTGSPRRVAQLLALRPDLEITPIRGNVDTRLRKLEAREVDALILAAAGLARLGLLDRVTEFFTVERLVSAVGQGALAVEARTDDAFALKLAGALDHPETRVAVVAERAFLQALGGGCQLPIAAYGRVLEEQLVLDGLVASADGKELLKDRALGPQEAAEALGQELAERLMARGAIELLQMEPA